MNSPATYPDFRKLVLPDAKQLGSDPNLTMSSVKTFLAPRCAEFRVELTAPTVSSWLWGR